MSKRIAIKTFLITALFMIGSVVLCQTTYTTINSGAWNGASQWDANGVPPITLPSGDSIFINHTIIYNLDQIIRGTMVINATGSITGLTKSLKIGRGAINQGTLINYGSITIDKLKVKPDNGCAKTDLLPIAHNYGIITTDNGMHVGNNCGAGRLNNYTGGKVYVTGGLHLDGAICNQDTMTFTGIVKVHGGTLECCGYIETPEIDVDANGGRSATLGCINICSSDGSDPILDFDGTDYTPLSSVPSNPTEYTIDDDSTAICGEAINGPALPIVLISFEANINKDKVDIKWVTSSEINNDFFTIERSVDAENWEEVITSNGAGNSSQIIEYFEVDYEPIVGVSYYRLKQSDFDGEYKYFNIVPVKYEPNTLGDGIINLFPNPVTLGETLYIDFTNILEKEMLVVLRDIRGREFYSKMVINIEGGKLVGVPIDVKILAGVYLITASSENQIYSQKLIIR
ncbi:MAG: hypothetical protein COA97_00405 [Flavobacteriales bacterium]|nr:MAG: hypothetical protein COA97_00405 [Flavobacteriales bacterium]